MSNFKSKAKKFWEENKGVIIACAAGVAAAGVGLLVDKSYRAGFVDGGMVGVEVGARWLDKTYPEESHAVELFERFAKEHPDQVIHRKGPGKWS